MSQPCKPQPAKLVIGMLTKDKTLLSSVGQDLTLAYGAIDLISPWMPFGYTDYYAAEMGKPLFRRMLVFEKLIDQTDLSAVKVRTNAIELEYADSGKRRASAP